METLKCAYIIICLMLQAHQKSTKCFQAQLNVQVLKLKHLMLAQLCKWNLCNFISFILYLWTA